MLSPWGHLLPFSHLNSHTCSTGSPKQLLGTSLRSRALLHHTLPAACFPFWLDLEQLYILLPLEQDPVLVTPSQPDECSGQALLLLRGIRGWEDAGNG